MVMWGLLRPRGLGFVMMLPWFGYGFAHWAWAADVRGFDAFVYVIGAWALLHAGTMWWNAALDRDVGPVLWGRALPVPEGIERWATLALAAAPVVAWGAGTGPFLCACACALLAVLYSSPVTRWKADPVLGPAVNVVGYGVLSPLAGWLVVDVDAGARTIAVFAAMGVLTLGIYFAAQVFQREEDAARGYRTLVVTHGPLGALAAARVLLGGGFAVFFALIVVGWLPRPCLIAAPVVIAADRHMARWAARLDEPGAEWGNELSRHLILAALLLIIGAFVDYGWSLFDGTGRVAGRATAGGWPG